MLLSIVLKTIIILECCELCLTIKVPVVWNDGNKDEQTENKGEQNNRRYSQRGTLIDDGEQFSVETLKPRNGNSYSETIVPNKPIPVQYFEYPAQKPQFAVDIASFHGVKSPKNHYKAYPITPETGFNKPQLGNHHITNKNQFYFEPFLRYTQSSDQPRHNIKPVSSNYEVYHPYKAEEPALKEIYKDPTLVKIRNDIRDNKNRLQNYEKEAGVPHVSKEDDLRTPEGIDKDKFPIENEPADYEIHRPQPLPVYYRSPIRPSRNNYLNRRFKHPLSQNYIKIKPANYRPLQSQLHKLQQNLAQKYNDEHNEYPQVRPEAVSEQSDGYDIYENGKQKYVRLRNNVDNAINDAVIQNRPELYTHLDIKNSEEPEDEEESEDDDEDFVPVKSYAQVRKSETARHLPREAALDEATSYEEIRNAPRLREAVKSTKAQTVYTEEGYEDSAYDHAGEQKHASDHEGHGGFLKQNELSVGKYKAPYVNAGYEDGDGSEQGDAIVQVERYNDDGKDVPERLENETSNEDEYDESIDADIYQDTPEDDSGQRNKRNDKNVTSDHEVNKREINFKIPEFNFTNTFLTEDEILKISKQHLLPSKVSEQLSYKYPYYNKPTLNENSPLRYAENLKFIPQKTKGGTEFYDSRSSLVCPDVDEEIDPIPENVKKAERGDDTNNEEEPSDRRKRQAEKKEKPRLKGLGDKIDCFKAKYFGQNPLDSPFFKEDVIVNPEPIQIPELPMLQFKHSTPLNDQETKYNNNVFNIAEKLRQKNKNDIFTLIQNLNNGRLDLQKELKPEIQNLSSAITIPAKEVLTNNKTNSDQANVYTDVLHNIQNKNLEIHQSNNKENVSSNLLDNLKKNVTPNSSIVYQSYINKEEVTKSPFITRKKRSTSFIYEPYKVIRDNHANDSKKTTTSNNVSPLIKQLQSSRVVDVIPSSTEDKRRKEKIQPVKRNVASRQYKDIGKEDRENKTKIETTAGFVDVNIDKRRGEPRYEMVHSNHKTEYTPVKNKKSISLDDFKAQTSTENSKENNDNQQNNNTLNQPSTRISRQRSFRQPTPRPFFDVSKYLPRTIELQATAASKTVQRVIRTTTSTLKPKKKETVTETTKETDKELENYDDYYDEEEDPATTTTIRSPLRIRKEKVTSTANYEEDAEEEELTTVPPKLRLVTRFRKPIQEKDENKKEKTKAHKNQENPKYTEKTKKTRKNTLVTDSQSYGEDEDDMRRAEIDAMIGVQHDMEDYMPSYEKEQRKHFYENESQEDEEQDDDEEEEYEDDSKEENDDSSEDEERNDEEDDEEIEETSATNSSNNVDNKTTKEIGSNPKNPISPIVLKRKTEIHQELPSNKSSPHFTQFKQDIVEEETVKKLPQKNSEALELYRDEDLATNVNKLLDVDVFKQDLDVKNGPKHGGNYRSAVQPNNEEIKRTGVREKQLKEKSHESLKMKQLNYDKSKEKKVTQDDPKERDNSKITNNTGRGKIKHSSENIKEDLSIKPEPRLIRRRGQQMSARLEIEENDNNSGKMHGGNLKHINEATAPSKRRRIDINNRNAKLEIEDTSTAVIVKMHGGNLVHINEATQPTKRRRSDLASAKLEINETDDDDDIETQVMHGGNLKYYPESNIDVRRKSADLLNSFAQAVPILTTPPAYILDPSKRMYYYVEA